MAGRFQRKSRLSLPPTDEEVRKAMVNPPAMGLFGNKDTRIIESRIEKARIGKQREHRRMRKLLGGPNPNPDVPFVPSALKVLRGTECPPGSRS